jgi:hypothetical protein
LKIRIWWNAEGKIDEKCTLRLGYFLRISRHIGLPDTLPGLERHLENESFKGQLSGRDFYYLGFGGRWVSLRQWTFEFSFSLRWEGSIDKGKSHASLREKQRHCVGPDPKRKWGKDQRASL